MSKHVVRRATAGDAAPILELRERSILALCVGDYTEEQIDAWMGKRLAKGYQEWIENSPFFVSTLGGSHHSLYVVDASERYDAFQTMAEDWEYDWIRTHCQ